METTNGAGSARGPCGRERQLHIGECLALVNYAEEFRIIGIHQDLGAMLDWIDRRCLCTTCGWSPQIHTAERQEGVLWVTCGSYAPAMHRQDPLC